MKFNSLFNTLSSPFVYVIAIAAGVAASFLPFFETITIAEALSAIFMNLLSLVSLPIIFLSIVSSATKGENQDMIRRMGKRLLSTHF